MTGPSSDPSEGPTHPGTWGSAMTAVLCSQMEQVSCQPRALCIDRHRQIVSCQPRALCIDTHTDTEIVSCQPCALCIDTHTQK